MRRSSVVLALACAILLACSQEITKRQRLVAEQQLEGRLTAWVRHMNNAKLDSLSRMYHRVPELTVVRADGRRSAGWEQEAQVIREFYRRVRYMNFVLQDPRIDVLDMGHAVTIFRHSTDVVDSLGLRAPVAAGQGTILWVRDRRDNLWKIYTQQLSVNAPSIH